MNTHEGYSKTTLSGAYLLKANGGLAAFNWSGKSGLPTWLWGGNSQDTYYVYNPSNFSVNYANSAGKVSKDLVIKCGSADTEGTNLFTYNGSATKEINLTSIISDEFKKFENRDDSEGATTHSGNKITKVWLLIGNTSKYCQVNWADYAGISDSLYGGTTGSTDTRGHWTVTIPGIASLYDGLTIHVKLSTLYYGNGEGYNTLNVNNLGAKIVWYGYNNRLTTHYGLYAELTLTYRTSAGSYKIASTKGELTNGTTYTDGWVIDAQYDTNDINTYTEYAGETTGTVGLKANSLIMRTSDNKWDSIVTTSSNGTTKTVNTAKFLVGSKLWYSGYNVNASTGLLSAWRSIYSFIRRFDFRYSSNCGTTLTAGKPVYLVGVVGSDGYFVFDSTTWWTLTLPTTADGKVYILVGGAYNTYQVDLYENNEWVEFTNGSIHPYYGNLANQNNGEAVIQGLIKGNYSGGTGSNAWSKCKVIAGEVYYYDRTTTSAGNGKLTLAVSDLILGNTFTANTSSDVSYTIPLATLVAKASGAADNSGTNTYGAVKGCAEGSTGTGAWRYCKIVNGVVYYYDRANPTSLKNPYSLSWVDAGGTSVSYDGSAAKSISTLTLAPSTANSTSVGLQINYGILKITNYSNTLSIGSLNSSWCHFYNSANVPFIFNKGIAVMGAVYPYSNDTYDLGTSSYKWKRLYLSNLLISSLATGTSPFSITSTTKVSNLNVDMLDDYHADHFFLNFGSATSSIDFDDSATENGCYYINKEVEGGINLESTTFGTGYGLILAINSGAGHLQLGMPGSSNIFKMRSRWWSEGEGAWGDWVTLIHSGNYTNYLGYIGTTAVQASSTALSLTGINHITFTPSAVQFGHSDTYTNPWEGLSANFKFTGSVCSNTLYASGGVISNGANAFRCSYGSYGVILRSDGGSFYLLSTASGSSLNGSWNTYRPFLYNYTNGNVSMQDNLYLIQSNKYVGIGTSSPGYKLHVSGSGKYTGDLNIDGSTYCDGTYTMFGSSGLYFCPDRTNGGGSLNTQVSHTHKNSVMSIGVSGVVSFPHDIYISDGYNLNLRSGSSGYNADSGDLIFLESTNKELGRLYYVNGGSYAMCLRVTNNSGTLSSYYFYTDKLQAPGSYYANSDIRYKNVLEYLNPTSKEISELPLFKYKWMNRKDDDIHVGSSALAAEQIVPELVSEKDDFKSLDYATLGVISGVTACREIEKLKQRIKELEEKLNG